MRPWLALSCVLGAALAATIVEATRPDAPEQGRPLNVLVLVIDDARWDTVGAAGNPIVQTPRLDRLAAEITSRDRIPTSHAVVRRDWKYVSWPEFDYEQLFDLGTDPGELANLADRPGHEGTRLDFRRRLEAWQARAR